MSHTNPSNQFQIPNIHSRNLDEWLNSNSSNANYQKNLDEWLNNTMKEMPSAYSASSSEFLDTNRTTAINGVHLANAAMANAFRLVPELQVNLLLFFRLFMKEFSIKCWTSIILLTFETEYPSVWFKC